MSLKYSVSWFFSKNADFDEKNLVAIDQFFVARNKKLQAAARKVNATSGQIFRVRDKKLIDWDQIEFSLLCRFAFEARKKQHTNQSLVKIGSTNPHKKLHVPPHAYRAAAANFLRRKKTKNWSKRTKLNFHFSLACFFDKNSSTTQKSSLVKIC